MLLIIIFTVLLYIGFGVLYFNSQNSKSKMGGKIASSKTLWLFLALYVYYCLPVFLLFDFGLNSFQWLLWIILSIMILRLVVQGILMYYLKAWKPIYGMLFNGGTILVVAICILISMMQSSIDFWSTEFNVIFYAFLIMLFTSIDSYYAYHFEKIVEGKTQGNDAIWFADQSSGKFDKILKVTRRNNIICLLLVIVLLTKIASHT